MDMGQYLDIFIEESKEHLQSLNENLLKIENDPENMEILNEIFRSAHTLKGMSGTMGFSKMQKLTHNMENVFSEIRNSKLHVNSDLLDIVFKCLDALENYIANITSKGTEGDNEYNDIIQNFDKILKDEDSVKVSNEIKVETTNTSAKNQINLDKNELKLIATQEEAGLSHYEIKVELNKGCVLKSARSFIVLKTVEEHGQIIKSNPKMEDIEDERFEFDFALLVSTKEGAEVFIKGINSIAEIEKVEVIKYQGTENDQSQQNEKEQKEQKEEKEEKEEIVVQERNEVIKEPQKEDDSKKTKSSKTVRVDIDRLDTLMNLVSELIIVKTRLEGGTINGASNETVEYLERVTTSLHDAVMKVRMVPVERVFNRFPRMIRDIARNLDKDIELHMSGEETELDRTVIDEIGDPLIHLLRNAADHGLETQEERKKTGKNMQGSIYLRAYQDGNNVVIEVEDDGKGINIQKVKNKAIEKGVISKEIASNMSEQDIIELLFKPSFSTAEKISDLSGRGVGLDVVKTKIEALGGNIEVKTELNKGSKFIVRLPLTLAIIQVLMVKIGDEKYAIPLNTIQTIEDVNVSDIKFVQKREAILLRNSVIPIIRLDDMLDIERKEQKDTLTVVIVKKGEKQEGFVIDSLIGQQEIVIKSLGKYLNHIKMIAGATILGNGEVALILDINTLI